MGQYGLVFGPVMHTRKRLGQGGMLAHSLVEHIDDVSDALATDLFSNVLHASVRPVF